MIGNQNILNNSKIITVTKTLSANNTSANVNLFKLTGSIKNVKIYGVLTSKTTLTNMTGVYFDLYDSTAAVAITKNDGVMSTAVVGAVIAKTAVNTTTASINLAATGTIIDAILLGFAATQKNGANTYIRFNYATTDAPIAATIKFFAEFEPLGGGYLEVV